MKASYYSNFPRTCLARAGCWLGLAGAAAIASTAAGAQTAAPASQPQAQPAQQLEEITVTSSRLEASGFDAPTPTTSIGAMDIEARGLPNIADYLNEMPAFMATGTPTSRSFFTSSLGLNTLDLRGLGPNRTLVLVNGRRHVPATAEGAVDINTVPMAIIKRVEVVTGGASAAWGSDAISGVVNILLDDKFDGLRTSMQYGSSTRGDAGSSNASIAYGGAVGDEGHLVVAAEWQKSSGLGSQRDRRLGREGWALVPNPDDTGPNDGIAANKIVRNAGLLFANRGGLVFGPNGPVQFGPGGALRPFDPGQGIAGNWVIGGDGGLVDSQLVPDTDRMSLMATFRRELGAGVEFFFESSYAESSGSSNIVPPFMFPLSLSADNPYVPADFKDQLDQAGLTGFDMFRIGTDLGFIHTTQKVSTFTAVAGLRGEFGAGWNWDVYAQHGRTINNLTENNLLVQNLLDAANATQLPGGDIVCAATLTGGARGCSPLNLFGHGSPSQAAIDYVMGEAFSRQQFTQRVAAATLRGELFQGWAGPIVIATGAEYREDKLERSVDEHSANGDFLISNYQPLNGSIDVSEVFLEAGVPLLADLPLARSLDLNAAIRYTDYSTSGSVNTWKVGATYAPIEDVKLRVVRSHDIRSPNVSELFTQGALNFFNVRDPFTGTTPFVRLLSTGNPSLQPEEADTTTLGLVLQPGFAPGLRASFDWYDIKLKDRIAAIDPQEVMNLCFKGDAALCSLITRDANGQVVEMRNTALNIAESRYSGVDFEVQYLQNLADWFASAGGSLTFKMWGNYIDKMEIAPNGVDTINLAGSLSGGEGAPQWRWEGSVSYDNGPLGLVTSVRYVGAGKYNANYTREDLSAADNEVGARFYVNMSASYAFDLGKARLQAFLGMNNVFDTTAPPLPDAFISQRPTNAVLYDVLGRYVYGGVRMNFF